MATSNTSRFLSNAGDDQSLALTQFWGTVLETFRAKTLLWNSLGPDGVGGSVSPDAIVASMVVNSGKSWEFPIIGDDPTPQEHTPGVELLGQDVDLDKGTITIDKILVSHYEIPLDHTQLSHFNVLEPFARKLGRSLAIKFDQDLFITGVKAANTAASTGFHNGGNAVNRNSAALAAAYPLSSAGAFDLYEDISTLARAMDEDNVPEDGRYLFMVPYLFQVLTCGRENFFFDADLGRTENNLMNQVVGKIARFNIMPMTTHLPSTNITTGQSKYQGDFTAKGGSGTGDGLPGALALCGAAEGDAAIGYVSAADAQLGPIYAHRHFDERRNTTFMKAQMMVGADVLAPWCAGVIQV